MPASAMKGHEGQIFEGSKSVAVGRGEEGDDGFRSRLEWTVLRMPLWMAKALEPLMCMVTAQKIDWVVFPISSLAFHHKVEPNIFSECLGMPIKIAWVGGEYRWTEVKDANIVESRDVTSLRGTRREPVDDSDKKA